MRWRVFFRLAWLGLALVVLWIAPEGIVGAVQKLLQKRKAAVLPKAENAFELEAKGAALQVSNLSIAFGGVKALAELPSLDELRAKIIGLLNAPATKIARTIKEPGGMLARVIQAKASQGG